MPPKMVKSNFSNFTKAESSTNVNATNNKEKENQDLEK